MKPDPIKIQALQDLTTPAEPETTTVLPWVSELPTTLSARHSFQDHLPERASLPMILDTINR